MGSLTKTDLAELEKLAAEATPGPWEESDDVPEDVVVQAGADWIANVSSKPPNITAYTDPVGQLLTAIGDVQAQRNAAFIARARTAVPELVAHIRKLHALGDKLADFAWDSRDGRATVACNEWWDAVEGREEP